MFDNKRYITRGVSSEVPIELQMSLWFLIEDLPIEKDYLQVFKCSGENGKQKIEHIQEEPEYKKEYLLEAGTLFIGKIFVIDDGDHSTMMLAEEY